MYIVVDDKTAGNAFFSPMCKQHFQDSARVHYYRVPFFPGAIFAGAIFSGAIFFPVPFFPDPACTIPKSECTPVVWLNNLLHGNLTGNDDPWSSSWGTEKKKQKEE